MDKRKFTRQIAWNDEELAIPFPVKEPILAQHDVMRQGFELVLT